MQIKIKKTLQISCLCFALASCASFSTHNIDKLIAEGSTKEALGILEELAQKEPQKYKLKYFKERDLYIKQLLQKATLQRNQGNLIQAQLTYQNILNIQPDNHNARIGIDQLLRTKKESELFTKAQAAFKKQESVKALSFLQEILASNPLHAKALQFKKLITVQNSRKLLEEPELNDKLNTPIALELREASLQEVLEIFSSTSGLNFMLDKDVKANTKTTIFAKRTTVADALNLILTTNQLHKKTLNETTLLIYQDTPEKRKKYEELITRNFYLTSANTKNLSAMIKALAKPKSIFVDDDLKLISIRDNKEVIQSVERIIEAYDIAKAEVLLDVEILEVNSTDLIDAGIKYPEQLSLGISGAAGAGNLNGSEYNNLNRSNFNLFFPDPVLIFNLQQNTSNTKTLANPRIRVSNNEKAKILIGDKVPVITTTLNQTSSASTESISYIDVGLKLDVSPKIYLNNEVSIDIGLEVSNIAQEVRTSTGLLAYQIGTRNANTVLRLKDGETQVLAGLIKKDNIDSTRQIPLLGDIPILGRLFSDKANNTSNSEIILLITPHVLRPFETPSASAIEYASGTFDQVTTKPKRLLPNSDAIDLYKNEGEMIKTIRSKADNATDSNAITRSNTNNALTPYGATNSQTPLTKQKVQPLTDKQTYSLSADLPATAQLNQEFNIALTRNIAAKSISFDLIFDTPSIQLIPQTDTPNIEVSQKNNIMHITVKNLNDADKNSPLLNLKFKPKKPTIGKVYMYMQNVKLDTGNSAKIKVPPPYSFVITQ